MKSTKSEDLPKDLPGNLRISPQKRGGFHDKCGEMNRVENKENDVLRGDLRTICKSQWDNSEVV